MEIEKYTSSAFYPFVGYSEQSEKPGLYFYIFVGVYTLLCFLLITPVVLWSEKQEKNKQQTLESEEQELGQNKEPKPRRLSKINEERLSFESASRQSPPLKATRKSTISDNSKQVKNANTLGDSARNTNKSKQIFSSLTGLKRSQGSSRETNTSKSKQPADPMSDIERIQSSPDNKQDTERLTRSLNDIKRSQAERDANKTKKLSKSLTELKRSQTSPNNDIDRTERDVSAASRMASSLRGALQQRFDKSYPDWDPEFRNRIAHRFPQQALHNQPQNENGNNTKNLQQQSQQQVIHQSYTNNTVDDGNQSNHDSNQPTAFFSSLTSAATTSKIHLKQKSSAVVRVEHDPTDKGFSKRLLDVGGRRWKTRRPIGRVDVIERQSPPINVTNTNGGGDKTQPSPRIGIITNSGINFGANSLNREGPVKLSNGMSDIASSILSEQYHQLNHQPQIQIDISLMKRHQFEQLYQLRQQEQMFTFYEMRQYQRGFALGNSQTSVMSSIVDDISPDDAADANDPGRGNVFIEQDQMKQFEEMQNGYQKGAAVGFAGNECCSSPMEGLLLLTVPDFDKLEVVKDAIPLAMGACTESLFRLITIAFISQILGTESMIAFLLVGLFVRLTSEELAGAIIDALSAFVQASMGKVSVDVSERNYEAGQYVQLGVVLQISLNVPLLVLWTYNMRQFVIWLLDNKDIAEIAESYANIVVGAYLVQALSRTLTVVFHICGNEHFESVIDLVAASMQVVAIAFGLILVDDADLDTVAYLQILINISSAIVKMAYPAITGWMKPYNKGLFQNIALWNNTVGIWHLLKAVGPLLLGSVLEYGEWELLTVFVGWLGPAEVAAWALLGALWDLFEALTEGFGEAAANKMCYLLSSGHVDRAKNLSYGVIYMAVVQSVLITSVLYMSGQYLTVLLVPDTDIRRITNDAIAMFGFAHIIMSYSRITWSLVGSQGRFRLATFVVFFSRWLVTMPCALICIYGFRLDLSAVSGSLVVGYATACSLLTIIVLKTDWHRVSRVMQIMNRAPAMDSGVPKVADGDVKAEDDEANAVDPILGILDLDDFDDSDDDDSDSFGFGDYEAGGGKDGTLEQRTETEFASVSTKESHGREQVVQKKAAGRQSQTITPAGTIVIQLSDEQSMSDDDS